MRAARLVPEKPMEGQTDVKEFVEQVLSRPLRMANRRRLFADKTALEWEVDGKWIEAIPMNTTEQNAASDPRSTGH